MLVCNEGYASSLAAATLQDLGLAGATDLAGGYRAWREHVGADGVTSVRACVGSVHAE